MAPSSKSNTTPQHKPSAPLHQRSDSTPKSPCLSLSQSQTASSETSETSLTLQTQDQPYQQQSYSDAAETNDPFFRPEGEAKRTQRLNGQLDTLISRIQFPGEEGAGVPEGAEVLRPRDESSGEEEDMETETTTTNTEPKPNSKSQRLAESKRDLRMTKGTGKAKGRGKQAAF